MGNMVVVKISDISELVMPKEQTKILKNQLVLGLSNLLSDSVKNSDMTARGGKNGHIILPIRLTSARLHMGHM